MKGKQPVFYRISRWNTGLLLLLFMPQLLFATIPEAIPASLRDYIESIEFTLNDHEVSVNFEKQTANRYYVALDWAFDESKELEDLKLSVNPKFRPTFHWAPHLTPTQENVIAQHVFRSPALIVHDEERWMALIPDLTLLKTQPKVPWYLDMNAGENQLTLGMAESRPTQHVLYERVKSTRFPAGNYSMGFYVLVSSAEKERKNPFGEVNRFMWKQWGEPLFTTEKPDLGAALAVYVDHTYRWAFQNWREQVWQEFDMDGQRVGAPTFIVNVTQSPNYTGLVNEREFRSIWNQAWFSSLRSASGLFRYARRKGIDSLKRYANLTKELALAFPQDDGLFSGLIATEMENLELDGQTYRRSKGWDTRYFGNSNRNPFTDDPKQAPYHLLDMSYTALLMLDWYRELDADERLLDYAKNYANALLSLQRQDGYFPAWLAVDTRRDMETLSRSPESAISVTFLLKLYQITADASYKKAALWALETIGKDVVAEGRWEDFETYWSCSHFGQDHVGRKFPRNQMHKQNTLSIYYTAQAYMEAYKTTNDIEFLDAGQRVMDELLMWQAVWQPPFIYISALGGFGVMNADAEWNDSRQSLFAELIMDYGKILNREDYMQRGIAAIRASFVLMYCRENQQTKEQWEHRWPFLAAEDFGFMMENYGHDGVTSSQGIGIGEFTIYDWGNGAAAEAVNRIRDHWGDVF
ncbi:MAG: hypothetical protein ACTHYC_01425 [Sphingobacterium sp.]